MARTPKPRLIVITLLDPHSWPAAEPADQHGANAQQQHQHFGSLPRSWAELPQAARTLAHHQLAHQVGRAARMKGGHMSTAAVPEVREGYFPHWRLKTTGGAPAVEPDDRFGSAARGRDGRPDLGRE